MENTMDKPLSNLQLEILKLYKANLSEAELLEVSAMLSAYLTRRAITLADAAWDAQGWDEQRVQELLKTKMRTPYKNTSL